MTPEELLPFFAAYAVCAGSAIFFSLFAVAVFLGLAVIDVWRAEEYSKQTKVLLLIGLALFPEIGVMSWVMHFGRGRKLIFRIIAFLTSGLYILLQVAVISLSMHDKGLGAGLVSALMVHFIWLPLILIGGAVSFLVLRAIFSGKPVPASN